MLFPEERHEPLAGKPWDEAAARAAIHEIAADAEARFDPEHGWPVHPLDADGPPGEEQFRNTDLYFGAAGVVWALERLRERRVAVPQRDYRPQLAALAGRATARWLERHPEHSPAYLIGDLGARLVQWKLDPGGAHGDALFAWISRAGRLPSNELMWGAPGVLLALSFIAAASRERRWRELLARELDAVLALWQRCPHAPVDLWEQDFDGQRSFNLDSVHGSAGNLHAVLRAAELLADPRRAELARRGARAMCELACVEGELANWRDSIPPPPLGVGPEFLVHFCHGAPGFIVCLDAVPTGESPELDRMLVRAGQLVWCAGPLRKGPNLCHGTAGNGHAFLKLWHRTRESVWLERARAFAMHAIEQVRAAREEYGCGRYSLWTGDVGVALYLASCIAGDRPFPTLDEF